MDIGIYGSGEISSLTFNYKNFIYLEDQGFIFAYVPKVACTNWKCVLRYMSGYEDWFDNKLAHDKVAGGLRYLDLSGSDAALLSDSGIKKYAMVRDPFSRALSGYLNKIESRLRVNSGAPNEDYFAKVVHVIDDFRRTHLDREGHPEVSFTTFLRWISGDVGPAHMRMNEHWAPQFNLLSFDTVNYDIIGRMEQLDIDAPRILEAMGCPIEFPSPEKVSFPPTNATHKLEAYYTEEATELVRRWFAKDFEALNYPPQISAVA